MLSCEKLPNCLSEWLYHFAFLPAMNESFCHSTPSSVFGVLSALDYVHSNRDVLIVVVLICSHLIYIMLSIFPNACHLCIFFDKICHHLFIFLLGSLSFKCPLYILDSSSLSDMHFCHIFSKPVTWFFIIFFFIFFFLFFISWRLITSQYCSGFCHTLTRISHGFTCIPHPDPPSYLP